MKKVLYYISPFIFFSLIYIADDLVRTILFLMLRSDALKCRCRPPIEPHIRHRTLKHREIGNWGNSALLGDSHVSALP